MVKCKIVTILCVAEGEAPRFGKNEKNPLALILFSKYSALHMMVIMMTMMGLMVMMIISDRQTDTDTLE